MKVHFTYILLFLTLCLFACGQKTDTSMKFSFDLPKINVEKMPEFPGGVEAMKKYLKENVDYPDLVKKEGLQGKCFVKFIIKADGSVGNVSVLKGVAKCAECDAEAIRVVRAMPNWKPGIVDKKPTPIYLNLPIIFKAQ
jgi:TonB family protein